jgi:hypothetical protein
MWPPEFLEVMRPIVQALQDATALNRELSRRASAPRETRPTARGERPYRPSNPLHRSWRGFREDMQKAERTVRQNLHLQPTDTVSKLLIQQHSGLQVKTITRIMTLTYGLAASDWPPSTWPAERRPTP